MKEKPGKKSRGPSAATSADEGNVKQQPMRVGPVWHGMTELIMKSTWQELIDQRGSELFDYIRGEVGDRIMADMRDISIMEGIRGDQGMMENFLNAILKKLPNRQPLNAAETFGLCIVLARIVRSPQGVQLASGAEKRRGGPKQGAKSIGVALEVIREVTHGTANSFEEAWAAVAARLHLSESAVKKCWMERRSLILATLRCPLDITAAQLVADSIEGGLRKA